MSAYGTKKANADFGVQVTFPAVFNRAFAGGTGYFPSDDGGSLDVMVGENFQSRYHQEKRDDANRSVLNGLQARQSMERKLLTGPHNYHVPRPVLGQRRFANPMNGVVGFPSARRDDPAAPFAVVETGMTGGVLKTREGQNYYIQRLQSRIAQLDRLNALAQGFAVPMGQSPGSYNSEQFGTKDKVTFFIYLRALSDSILTADYSRFTFENLKEMMDLLFRFAPRTATQDDFKEMIDGWEEMLETIRGSDDDPRGEALAEVKEEYEETLKIFLEKGFQYIREMAANVFRETRDKEALSRALINSLGFTRFLTKGEKERDVLRRVRRTDARVDDALDNYDDGDDDGRFDRPAETREDTEAEGQPRAPLAGRNADPNRERYGEDRGTIVLGGPEGRALADAATQWFGEGEQEVVQPLALSGTDPEADVPVTNPRQFLKPVLDELKQQLTALGWSEGTDMEEFFSKMRDGEFYDEETLRDLATEVGASLESKGFTKAQIAEGMRLTGLSLFDPYVGENTGDIQPAALQSRRVVQTEVPLIPSSTTRSLLTRTPVAEPSRGEGAVPGLPTTRAELLNLTDSQLRQLGTSPAFTTFSGRAYQARAGTKRRSVLAALIARFKEKDPNF